MHHAFGGPGRSRGVQDEQRVLGVHGLAGAIVVDRFFGFVQPDVASVHPVDVVTRVANHEDLLERVDRNNFV